MKTKDVASKYGLNRDKFETFLRQSTLRVCDENIKDYFQNKREENSCWFESRPL